MMAFISQPLVESSRYAEVSDADKGNDSQVLRELVRSRNAKHVIPRVITILIGRCIVRHLVENAFLWLPMWVD